MTQVEFGARVPQDEYEFFKENFPQYGAVTWFVNTALSEFNQRLRDNPSAKEQIEKSIEALLGIKQLVREPPR